jgi:hypothetical protein
MCANPSIRWMTISQSAAILPVMEWRSLIIVAVLCLGPYIGHTLADPIQPTDSSVVGVSSLMDDPLPKNSGLDLGIVHFDPAGKQVTVDSIPNSPLYNQIGVDSQNHPANEDATLSVSTVHAANGVKCNVAGVTLDSAFNTAVETSKRWSSVSEALKRYWSVGLYKSINLQPVAFLPQLNLDFATTYIRDLSETTENISTSVFSYFNVTPLLKVGVTTSYYLQRDYSMFSLLPGLTSTICGWDMSFYGESCSSDTEHFRSETMGVGGSIGRKF